MPKVTAEIVPFAVPVGKIPSHHHPFKRLRLGRLIAAETAVLRYDCQHGWLAFGAKIHRASNDL